MSEPTTDPNDPEGPVWCVVANVIHERPYGPGGAVLRQGTKHFAPGAKVHVVEFFWGTAGKRVTVVGRYRRSKRFVTLSMNAEHLANWRAELVYSPHVIEEILKHSEFSHFLRGSPEQRARAEEIATSYINHGSAAQPFTTRPPTASP